MSELRVRALYGAKARQPLVQIQVQDVPVQCTPAEARAFAQTLMEAAEAAEQDAFLFEFTRTVVLASHPETEGDAAAVKLLQEYREWRARRAASEGA